MLCDATPDDLFLAQNWEASLIAGTGLIFEPNLPPLGALLCAFVSMFTVAGWRNSPLLIGFLYAGRWVSLLGLAAAGCWCWRRTTSYGADIGA